MASYYGVKTSKNKFKYTPEDLQGPQIFENFILSDTLYTTYVHSNINTFTSFLEAQGESTINKINEVVNNINLKSLKRLKERINFFKSLEKKFCQKYFNNVSKEEALKELNNVFFNSEGEFFQFKTNFYNLKTQFKKIANVTNKKYQDQIKDSFELLNNFLIVSDEYLKNYASTKYGKKLQNLRDKFSERDSTSDKVAIATNKELGEIFKKLKFPIEQNLGWILEPAITKSLLDIFSKASAIGINNYELGKEVADIKVGEVESNTVEIQLGINVKSTLNSYHIKRVTTDAYKELSNNPNFQKKEIIYFRKNLLALSLYNVDWAASGTNRSFLKKYYNKVFLIEKKFVVLYNLIKIFDTIEKTIQDIAKNTADPLVHSILISYGNGYIWTSDLLSHIYKILKDKIDIADLTMDKELQKVMSTSINFFNPFEAEDRILKDLYLKKKKKLKTIDKNKEDVYKQLNDDEDIMGIFNQLDGVLKHQGLIKQVWYEIKLENFKRLKNPNKPIK